MTVRNLYGKLMDTFKMNIYIHTHTYTHTFFFFFLFFQKTCTSIYSNLHLWNKEKIFFCLVFPFWYGCQISLPFSNLPSKRLKTNTGFLPCCGISLCNVTVQTYIIKVLQFSEEYIQGKDTWYIGYLGKIFFKIL